MDKKNKKKLDVIERKVEAMRIERLRREESQKVLAKTKHIGDYLARKNKQKFGNIRRRP